MWLRAIMAGVLIFARGAAGGASSVTSLNRDAGDAAGGVTVEITGTGFAGITAADVKFGGTQVSSIVSFTATKITCVAPAHTVGQVDVTVSGIGAGNQLFEYRPTRTTTFISHDFEDNTLGSWGQNITVGTVAPSTDFAFAGSRSAKCNVTGSFGGSGASLTYQFSSPTNPALDEANGIYLRWYQMIPSATINDVIVAPGQIKLHLFRQTGGSGQPGWSMPGVGNGFPPSDGSLTIQDDPSTGGAWQEQVGTTFGDGVWREIQLWYKRAAGVGRVIAWIDGKKKFDRSAAGVGSDNSALTYLAYIGLTYSQSAGSLLSYIDNPAIANGFIDP